MTLPRCVRAARTVNHWDWSSVSEGRAGKEEKDKKTAKSTPNVEYWVNIITDPSQTARSRPDHVLVDKLVREAHSATPKRSQRESSDSFAVRSISGFLSCHGLATTRNSEFKRRCNRIQAVFKEEEEKIKRAAEEFDRKRANVLKSAYQARGKVAKHFESLQNKLLLMACTAIVMLQKQHKIVSAPVEHKGITEAATEVFTKWFDQHLNEPYPTPKEKVEFVLRTGLAEGQISTWFSNHRIRCKRRIQEQESVAAEERRERLPVVQAVEFTI